MCEEIFENHTCMKNNVLAGDLLNYLQPFDWKFALQK